MCPSEVDVEVAPKPARIQQKRYFGRTGHRSPVAMAPNNCCQHDDWMRETLQALVLEFAVLKACTRAGNKSLQQQYSEVAAADENSDEAICYRLDRDYAAFLEQEQRMSQYYTHMPSPLPTNVIEVVGDIFQDVPDTMALGHSVAADFEMSAGIAVDFKQKFGQVERLLSMGRKVGQVAVLPVGQPDGSVRYVFYIITKERSRGTRPILSDFSAAVHDLAAACTLLGVKQIALPRIGTMKDRLQWSDVRRIIGQAFEGRDTEVYVFRRETKSHTVEDIERFIDRMVAKTPRSDQQQPDANGTPPFSTPDNNTTPPNETPTPVGTWPRPLPNEGEPSASAPGPCASKVVSEKKEDAGHASSLEREDNSKTLTTAQGPDRSVQISTTSATNRFLNDLNKSTSRKERRSSIPKLKTPNTCSNDKINTVDICASPDIFVNSDSQSQKQPPKEDDAGRQPAACQVLGSSASQPAEPQTGVAKGLNQAVNQSAPRAPIKYGGPRSYRQCFRTGNSNWQKNTQTQTFQTNR
jgi:O-acetyl-ADP-ribose deacetylase (regulator of RNase III)